MSSVTVVTSALRDEARKWKNLSDEMAPIKSAVDDLVLSMGSFFIGDVNAGLHSQAYTSFQAFVAEVLAGGVVEFDQMGAVLDRIADAYDRADEVADLNLDKIYTA